LHEIKVALVVRAAVVVQRSEGTVDELTGDGIMAVLGGRPRSARPGMARCAGAQCRL
jgi:hypothetical protein